MTTIKAVRGDIPGARTIAVPLLGAGSLGWPVDDSIAAAFDAVAGTSTSIDRVLMVSDGDAHHRIERALFQATALRILHGVRFLHRRGYHRVRVTPGISSSGTYWRTSIMTPENERADWGFVDNGTVIFYSTGGETEFASNQVEATTTPSEVADIILSTLPHLGATCDDPAYAQ